MKIFLHIGAPRTGTSTLQSLLHLNRDKLNALGLDYPKIAYTDDERGDAQHNLAFSLMDEYPAFVPDRARIASEKIWSEFAAYASASKKNILVSSEAFSALSPNAITAIRDSLKGFDVEVLYVARDAQSWHDSMARQQIKQYPYRTSLPGRFTGDPNSITSKQTQGWIDAGLTPTIIPYDRDVVRVLLAHLGIDLDVLTPVPKRNDSLPPQVLNLLMELNAIEIPHQKRGRLNRTLEGWWFDLARASPELTGIADILRSADTSGLFRREHRSLKNKLMLAASDLKRSLTGQAPYPRTVGISKDGQIDAEAELIHRVRRIRLEPDEHQSVVEVFTGWIRSELEQAGD